MLSRLYELLPAARRAVLRFVHSSTWTELNWTELNKSTRLHDALIGRAYQRHGSTSYWLTAAKLGRLVLGQFSTHVFQCGGLHWSSRELQSSSVEFVCCEQAFIVVVVVVRVCDRAASTSAGFCIVESWRDLHCQRTNVQSAAVTELSAQGRWRTHRRTMLFFGGSIPIHFF